ncbi:MAG: SMC-Scp complex subunit ScpB [Nitrospira sp.]|nr:SMC-Scp complex subunit ScpB [Nitrospira sp.]
METESSDKTHMPAPPVLSVRRNAPEVEGSEVEGTEAVDSAPDPSLQSMNGDAPGERPENEGPGLADGLSEQELKGIIEALLFVSPDPLLLDKVTTVLAGPPKVAVHNAMKALQHDYDQEGRGLQIVELAGGYVMITRSDCAPWITKLNKVKASAKVSRSALETLAIIAYKQPIMRAEIEQIRGVETSSVLRTLLDQKLIRIVGRKDIPGRPILYGTSKVFLQKFGLRDLRDLPPLRDFAALGQGENPELFEELSPGHDQAGADPVVQEPTREYPEPVAT